MTAASPSRRSVLTAIAVVPVAGLPALADEAALASHPDAELLRLGAEFRPDPRGIPGGRRRGNPD
jgi:hypothetical protein